MKTNNTDEKTTPASAGSTGSEGYATATREGFVVPLIGIPKSAGLDKHVPELHALGNDLEEWCEIRVRKDVVPKGAKLVEAYLTNSELVVMGQPKEDDETHNCDAQGCGSLSHVLYRMPLPNDQAHPTAAGGTGGAQKGL